MCKILLLEDDFSLITGLSFALEKAGYALDTAQTLHEADALWADGKYDLLILDVSLPDGSGFALCQKVRQICSVPIIFLTASDEETSMIMGLDIGGDDYITKPFKLAVLMSRINALLRRSKQFQPSQMQLQSNGISMHLPEHQVYKNGMPLALTASEYKLLRFLMENPNIVLSSEQIMSNLWDCDGDFIDPNTLTVYIRRLRTKIEDNPNKPSRIVTVRRIGYKWNAVN